MKNWLIIVVCLVVFSVPARSDDGKAITIGKMPKTAQEFVTKYFHSMEVAVAKQEGAFWERSYEVIFCNGNKLEFDSMGKWTSVDCKYTGVPQEIVPAPIAGYINGKFPGAKVLKIEKDDRRIDVELDNGVDLEFTNSYQLIEFDRD